MRVEIPKMRLDELQMIYDIALARAILHPELRPKNYSPGNCAMAALLNAIDRTGITGTRPTIKPSKNSLERAVQDLQSLIASLREPGDQRLLPNRVYTVSELASVFQLSKATIRRAAQAGHLSIMRGRILGEDAIKWFREGAKTGRNKNHVGFRSAD